MTSANTETRASLNRAQACAACSKESSLDADKPASAERQPLRTSFAQGRAGDAARTLARVLLLPATRTQ